MDLFSANPPGITEKLRNAHIFIAGAGGLGSNCAVMLVRAGAARLTVVDFDKVEPSNLNRQYFFRHQIGTSKVAALKENLLAVNPDIGVETICTRINSDNIDTIIPGSPDIILECFDSAESKALLVSFCMRKRDKVTVISVSGLAGTDDIGELKVTRISEKMIIVGDKVSAALPETGVLSTRVTAAAAIQAHEAVRVLCAPDK